MERCTQPWKKIKAKQNEKSVHFFLLFWWLLFCMLNIFRSQAPDHMWIWLNVELFTCKRTFIRYPFFRLLLLLPLGILLTFFFGPLMQRYSYNQAEWNNFLPCWLPFRPSLGLTKNSMFHNYEKFTIFIPVFFWNFRLIAEV